jgi:anti-sigma regulatory factor (Ser/Thr protein kinase)
VGRCREFVRNSLESRGWPDQRALEDVLLMASEIVTNACRYGGGAEQPFLVELSLREQDSGLRVEVADASAELPVLRPFSEVPRVGGHGLRIVDRLTGGRWGCEPSGSGKTVWFEVAWPPSRS